MSGDGIQPDHVQLIICRAGYHTCLAMYHTSLKRKCRETQRPNLTPCFVRSENMSTCCPIRCTEGQHLSLAVGHTAGQKEFVIGRGLLGLSRQRRVFWMWWPCDQRHSWTVLRGHFANRMGGGAEGVWPNC